MASFYPHGPTEQELNDLGDQMRRLVLKPPVSDHTNRHTHTHTGANTRVQLETYVYENTRESLNQKGAEGLDVDILHSCYSPQIIQVT